MAQLFDLVKPIEDMTDEELANRLFDLRHRRDVQRPAAKARVKKAQKKAATKAVSAAEKLLETLSPSELEALIRQAQGD